MKSWQFFGSLKVWVDATLKKKLEHARTIRVLGSSLQWIPAARDLRGVCLMMIHQPFCPESQPSKSRNMKWFPRPIVEDNTGACEQVLLPYVEYQQVGGGQCIQFRQNGRPRVVGRYFLSVRPELLSDAEMFVPLPNLVSGCTQVVHRPVSYQ